MSRWMSLVADGGYSWRTMCHFGPSAMIGGPMMAMQAAGTAMSAASTIAGGNTALAAGKLQQSADVFQADQLRENEGGAIGAAQRTMLDKQFQTKQMESTLEARGAGGGVNVGVGSPLAAEKSIASRGTYQSLLDLFNGQNKATGMENEARGLQFSGDVAEWEGETKKRASRLDAMATIAGGGATMARSFGSVAYPNIFGRPGIGYSG